MRPAGTSTARIGRRLSWVFAIQLSVIIRLGAEVVDIDFSAATVTLESGELIRGDVLLIANGLWSCTKKLVLMCRRGLPKLARALKLNRNELLRSRSILQKTALPSPDRRSCLAHYPQLRGPERPGVRDLGIEAGSQILARFQCPRCRLFGQGRKAVQYGPALA
jgi:hypothetical protein